MLFYVACPIRPNLFLQREKVRHDWRGVATFAAVLYRYPQALNKLQEWQNKLPNGENILKYQVMKEHQGLPNADIASFAGWLSDIHDATPKVISDFLARLRLRRLAIWGAMHPDNPHVHESKSMFGRIGQGSFFLFQKPSQR